MADMLPGQALDPQATEELLALLHKQRDLYQQLAQLSERQRDLITGDEPERLLTLLHDRDVLVKGLARVNQQMSPFRKNWDAIYNALPQPTRGDVAGILSEVNDMLQTIIRTDEQDGKLLEARKQTVSKNLNTLSDGKAAMQAYANQAAPAIAKRDQHG